MTWDEDYPDWFRPPKRMRSPFFNRFFEDIEKMMEETFKEVSKTIPKDLFKEYKLPDGTTVKEMGPIVYGYSMKIGPDGKPVVRQFGNIKPSMKAGMFGVPRPSLEFKDEREPLIDVATNGETVKVTAELPGVDKSDINLNCTENTLTISVRGEKRKYFKEINLPAEVDSTNASSSYKNGVLEVALPKVKSKPKPKGKEIKLD